MHLLLGRLNLVETEAAYANTNIAEPNADSIDLADTSRRIAVQVTSNTTAAKIKKTIRGFENNNRHEQFDHLRFLFLSNKYRPAKKDYPVSGAEVDFEDLDQLHARIVRIEDIDQVQRIVELLEKELAPKVPAGNAKVQLVKEKVTTNAEAIRVECQVDNLGEYSATTIQLSVWASIPGQIDVLPRAEWQAVAASGAPGSRTFQAEHAIHPRNSARAILVLSPTRDVLPGETPTFRVKLSANDTHPQLCEISASD